jgi:holo-[acyl-carrier protein] synthase
VIEGAVGRRVLAVGTDLVEVDRIRRALSRTPGFASRVFTPAEQAWAGAARDPAERYAVRWAAKEATLKAIGVGLGAVALTDVEVERHESGRPGLVLHGSAARLAADQGIGGWLVSLSHTASLAQAVVLATGEGGPRD